MRIELVVKKHFAAIFLLFIGVLPALSMEAKHHLPELCNEKEFEVTKEPSAYGIFNLDKFKAIAIVKDNLSEPYVKECLKNELSKLFFLDQNTFFTIFSDVTTEKLDQFFEKIQGEEGSSDLKRYLNYLSKVPAFSNTFVIEGFSDQGLVARPGLFAAIAYILKRPFYVYRKQNGNLFLVHIYEYPNQQFPDAVPFRAMYEGTSLGIYFSLLAKEDYYDSVEFKHHEILCNDGESGANEDYSTEYIDSFLADTKVKINIRYDARDSCLRNHQFMFIKFNTLFSNKVLITPFDDIVKLMSEDLKDTVENAFALHNRKSKSNSANYLKHMVLRLFLLMPSKNFSELVIPLIPSTSSHKSTSKKTLYGYLKKLKVDSKIKSDHPLYLLVKNNIDELCSDKKCVIANDKMRR